MRFDLVKTLSFFLFPFYRPHRSFVERSSASCLTIPLFLSRTVTLYRLGLFTSCVSNMTAYKTSSLDIHNLTRFIPPLPPNKPSSKHHFFFYLLPFRARCSSILQARQYGSVIRFIYHRPLGLHRHHLAGEIYPVGQLHSIRFLWQVQLL